MTERMGKSEAKSKHKTSVSDVQNGGRTCQFLSEEEQEAQEERKESENKKRQKDERKTKDSKRVDQRGIQRPSKNWSRAIGGKGGWSAGWKSDFIFCSSSVCASASVFPCSLCTAAERATERATEWSQYSKCWIAWKAAFTWPIGGRGGLKASSPSLFSFSTSFDLAPLTGWLTNWLTRKQRHWMKPIFQMLNCLERCIHITKRRKRALESFPGTHLWRDGWSGKRSRNSSACSRRHIGTWGNRS